jgi:hypothetical protein
MPSWKKVITSGSNAALNSLNVSTSLTASGIIYPTADGTNGQVLITDGAGNLSFSPVENTAITIKNVSGTTIQKGTPCYITGSGTSGNVAGVWPADASNPLRMPAGVIAGETLTAGAEGVGLINGFIGNVNTSAFTAGDTIYVAAGGGYTNVRPTGSAILIQKLGNVEKSHASNGSGVINGPNYYNEVPNIQQGFTWVGNSNGVAIPIATSSIQNVISSSFALTSSFLGSTTNAFIQNGNSFGTTALLGTNDNQPLAFETNATERMRITSTGNVGIGTTSPSTLLHVSGTAVNPFIVERNTANSNVNIQYKNATTSWYAGLTDAGRFAIGQNIDLGSSTIFNISGSGNVGIGTTSPAYRLQVNASGSSNSDLPLALTSVDVNNRVGISFASSSIASGKQHRLWHRVNTPTAEWLLNASAGETGIWRFQPLDNNNYAINLLTPYNGGTASITTGLSQSLFSLGAGSQSAQHLNISSSGNVGIGTTSPNAKLDVQGTVIVSSSILQYSNNAAITSGSTANIASFNTSSYTAGFFDYVATSGTNARAGSVFTVWNGNNVEYAETSTNDIGSTNNLILSASVSAGAIRLQGTSLSGSWSVKTLTRMI